MSSTSTPTNTAGPTPTPLPNGTQNDAQPEQIPIHRHDPDEKEPWKPAQKLRLNILDLNHPGASRFLAAVHASSVFADSVATVLRILYKENPTSVPGTRSVTLYLEDMPGVAYTTGSDLDNDHKEIHFSLGYIKNIKTAPPGNEGDLTGAYEIHGVLVHELVHCFQHNGRGTCPGGLIEGIADWVRLRANLGAPHWKRDAVPDKWDQGYEKTAYFLDWLEDREGEGTVRRINEALREDKYIEATFWKSLFGRGNGIEALWKEYLRHLRKGDEVD